nr:hypothetical protein [Lachnospiraceae bacterium]
PLFQGNLHMEELKLDENKDFSTGNHLSAPGVVKYTQMLWDKVLSKYDLADHRGDDYYKRWEENKVYREHNEGKDGNIKE